MITSKQQHKSNLSARIFSSEIAPAYRTVQDAKSPLQDVQLDEVFGCSFNTNGLGGVLTCGVTGVKAGLSHSPISAVRSI